MWDLKLSHVPKKVTYKPKKDEQADPLPHPPSETRGLKPYWGKPLVHKPFNTAFSLAGVRFDSRWTKQDIMIPWIFLALSSVIRFELGIDTYIYGFREGNPKKNKSLTPEDPLRTPPPKHIKT